MKEFNVGDLVYRFQFPNEELLIEVLDGEPYAEGCFVGMVVESYGKYLGTYKVGAVRDGWIIKDFVLYQKSSERSE